MIVNYVSNVNDALAKGLALMRSPPNVSQLETRGGSVLRYETPVATVTMDPQRRVLFSPARNANPFFHFMESLWMLAGRQDLPWLAQFNKRMAEYSDDGGKTQPAAYGHRWRNHFGYDQIEAVIRLLKQDPGTRRAVIVMWDGGVPDYEDGDLHAALRGSKDVPCNTSIYFSWVGEQLNMMVSCRSNDLWWGAHGANAVHFSILHEYVASALCLKVGTMTQVSNDYHLYTDVVDPLYLGDTVQDVRKHDYYAAGKAKPTVLFYDDSEVKRFDEALPKFMDFADPAKNPPVFPNDQINARRNKRELDPTGSFVIDGLAYPMLRAWDAQKVGAVGYALSWCQRIGRAPECDWRIACTEWVQRKFTKKGVL